MYKDFVPRDDFGFLNWSQNFISNLKAMAKEIHLETAAVTKAGALVSAYTSALEKARDVNRGRLDTSRKNEAKDAARKGIKVFIREKLANNNLVTEEYRQRLGIPVSRRSKHKAAIQSYPTVKTDISVSGKVIFRCRDSHTGNRGKPDGAKGVVLNWIVCDIPPQSPDDFTHTRSFSQNPFVLSFKEEQRRKYIFYRIRWQARKEQDDGPWSKIEQTVIA
jgi:hypothetical protein